MAKISPAHDQEVPLTPQPEARQESLSTAGSQPAIIWTPRFILFFSLLLILSLSLTSILAELWRNTGYPTDRVVLAYTVPVLICWIALLVRTRSGWIRAGAIFCLIWTLLKACNAIFGMLNIDTRSPALLHLNAATGSALLATYVCLALPHMPISHWDRWLLRLLPLVGAGLMVWLYAQSGQRTWSWYAVERVVYSTLLYVSLFLWWLRPSCWKAQPGLTLLLGAIPLIQAILYATRDTAPPTTLYFFSLIIPLTMLLAGIRLFQGEAAARKTSTSPEPTSSATSANDYGSTDAII
jgi:hypothetical protein